MTEPVEPLNDFEPVDEPLEFVRPNPDVSTEDKKAPSFFDKLSKPKPTVDSPKKTKPVPVYRSGMFVRPLTELYTGIGMVLMPFDPVCSRGFIEQAESCAIALDQLAKENHTARRILMGVVTTSTVGKVFAAHAPIIALAAMHHGGGRVANVGEQAEAFLRTRSPANEQEGDSATG
jgi:hypothetical protein